LSENPQGFKQRIERFPVWGGEEKKRKVVREKGRSREKDES